MKEAGCRGFSVGIETADAEVLQIINKRQRTQDSSEALRLLLSNGFPYIEPLLMYFNEAESVDSIAAETAFFAALGLPCPALGLHQYATPFPGTRFFSTCNESGTLFAKSWADYRTDRINFIPTSFLSSPFPAVSALWPEVLPSDVEKEAASSTRASHQLVSAIWTLIVREQLRGSVEELAKICAQRLEGKLEFEPEQVVKAVSLFAIVGTRLTVAADQDASDLATHALTEHRRAPTC
jgi:hypothetical protein